MIALAFSTWEMLLWIAFASLFFGFLLCWIGNEFVTSRHRSDEIVWCIGAFFVAAGIFLGIAAFAGCDYEYKNLTQ